MEKIFLIVLMSMNLCMSGSASQMSLSPEEQEIICRETGAIFGHLQKRYCRNAGSQLHIAHQILCGCIAKMAMCYVPIEDREGFIEEVKNYLLNETVFSISPETPNGCQCEAHDPEPEKEEFWPADMIPHPNPPWHRPKKPSDALD
jgi:hypothetical protein